MKKILKRLGVVIPSTILTLLMAVGFSTPAFAFVDTTDVTEEPTQVIEEAEPTEEEKIPFTIAQLQFLSVCIKIILEIRDWLSVWMIIVNAQSTAHIDVLLCYPCFHLIL